MKTSLLEWLRCPTCQSRFTVTGDAVDGDITTGTLRCVTGHTFPITRAVPRFVNADQYADSFSRQRLYVRRHFEHYRHDRSGDVSFFPTTGFTPQAVASGVSLEIGCGYGRYVDVVQRTGGTIIGVDLSTHSIDLAQDFVGHRPNVHLVQADLFALPFERGTFDQVYSLGVLHHTPDTKQAFQAIAPYARTGGRVSIWVYHPVTKRATERWRWLTSRMPHPLLYGLCIANQVLFSWVRRLPGGGKFSQLVPGNTPKPGQSFWLRVLADFDGFSPTYAWQHTPDEVTGWFAEAGLRQVQALERRTAVSGVAP